MMKKTFELKNKSLFLCRHDTTEYEKIIWYDVVKNYNANALYDGKYNNTLIRQNLIEFII